MKEKINFIVYCIEKYRQAKGITGKQAIELFNQYEVIDYIWKYFESLHTAGRQYTVDDINMYIESRKVRSS